MKKTNHQNNNDGFSHIVERIRSAFFVNNNLGSDFFSTFVYIIKSTLFRCVIVGKKKWTALVKKASAKSKHRLFFVFILGLFNFFASPPFSIIVILPLTFGSLFFVLDKQRNLKIKTQLGTIFFFLFGHFVGIFWWFVVPLTTDFLHLFWLTPFALLGLPFVIALCFMPFFAIGIIFLKIIAKRISTFNYDLAFFIMFLCSWFSGDYVRGHLIFGGFPWMLFGHFVKYPFAFQSVRLFGIDVYSILFLALVLSFYIIYYKKNNTALQKSVMGIVCFWLLNCSIGGFMVLFFSKNHLSQTIVGSQINYPASLNNERNSIDILNKNFNLMSWTAGSDREMIKLMPESAINMQIHSGDKIAKTIGKIVANDKSIMLAGGVYFEGFTPYNVIYSINSDGYIVSMYKKQKLVPFGEYIPVRKFMPFLTRVITNNAIDFATDGENDLFTFYRDLPIIYPIICYESIFPQYVRSNILKSRKYIMESDAFKTKQMKDADGLSAVEHEEWGTKIKSLQERGEIIVNLTNDAWLKWSVGPYQHFLMARFLAVSVGLPVIRMSNNGISAFIDEYGRIIEKTKLNSESILFVPGTKK